MKVKVIKARFTSYWYADKVGEVFEVVGAPSHSLNPGFVFKSTDEQTQRYFDLDDVEIVKEEKQMKKSDLRTGMRVVHGKHPRQEGYAIVVCDLDQVLFKDGGWNYLSAGTYSDDLKGGWSWDITEVYDVPERDILNFEVAGELLWKREIQTPEQKQLQEVMNKISELQEQAEKLQKLVQK